MEISALKKYRKIVPGTLILIAATPIYVSFNGYEINISETSKFLLTGVGIILCFIIGAFYEILKLRHLFNQSSHTNINNNIKFQLLYIGRTKILSEERRKELLHGSDLMHIFYQLIDSNDSLKEKSKIVKDNGLIWTSASDIVVIGGSFTIIYASIFLTFQNTIIFTSLIISLLLSLCVAIFIHPKIVEKHIELGNDQLDFIRVNLKKELQDRVDAL